jgi:ribosome-associated toxin RatA of RatAB toxin-antitoxin module
MSQVHVEVTGVIEAQAEEIYDIVGDYREGHPQIMPRKYFPQMTVEKGGKGVGTVVKLTVRFMGQEQYFRMEVIEAQPGRWILEREADTGLTTTSYKFEPLNGGSQTRLTIATDFTPSSGVKGLMEKLFNPAVMRRMYNAELRQIADYFRTHKQVATSN